LRVIGDISCDIEGSIECTATRDEGSILVLMTSGVAGDGVGHGGGHPAERSLRDASIDFSRVLMAYGESRADYSQPEQLIAARDQAGRTVTMGI
jgi:hypothetical protein